MATTLFRGGRIVDGSGAAATEGQLLVDGAQIEALLSPGEAPSADRVVELGGKVLAPGFIDVHAHVDFLLPMAENHDLLAPLLEQGITTVVAGNCGISPAPIADGAPSMVDRVAAVCIEEPLDYRWQGMGSYLDALERMPPPLNVAQLVGHTSVREAFGDRPRGALGPEALALCLREARRALDEGACGLSFGLGYDPGMFTPLDELKAFSSAAAAAGKLVTSHIKAYSILSPCYPATTLGAHNLRAMREMLEVARDSACRLQLSHVFVAGRRSWPTLERLLGLIDEARAGGLDLMIDAFPFHAGNSTVNALLPDWFLRDLPRNYHRRGARALLRAQLAVGFRALGFGFGECQLMNAGVAGWEDLAGERVDAIARRWGVSPLSAFLRLSEESRGAATMLFHGMSGDEDDSGPLDTVLSRPDCLFETDAVIRREGFPNPGTYGNFPRVLGHHVRERGLFSLEDAVHRMTGASADRFGLKDRGLLAAGRAADLVVFDPDTVAAAPDDAFFDGGGAAAMRPRGIERVFLNGVEVVEAGRALGRLAAGRVLRV